MKAAKRSGARALVEALERAGAEYVFGYPGGNVVDIFDCVRDSSLKFVLGRHEQGCVHMADGYARSLGRPGVVLVTSGPGLTNTITGLGAANMDGIPLVLICGQVSLDQIGTDAFQEADTTGLTRSVSKHNFLVKSADEIPETLAQAFYIATHGKPGPVVIDVPRDCQTAMTSVKYPERISLRAYHPEHFATSREIAALAKMLNCAKRPLIYAGGGVIASGASAEVTALAHKAGAPVVTTMMGIGTIDCRDPLSLGMAGVHGSIAANRALNEADVILALGVRFNDRTTGFSGRRFARQAKIIHVDCDPSSIDKNVQVALGIIADIKDLLTTVDSRIHSMDRGVWCRSFAASGRKQCAVRGGAAVLAREVVEAVGTSDRGDVVIVTDVGQHQLWAAKCYPHCQPRHFITSGGMGAMGFGIPAAIGAAIAKRDHRVVAMVGDGGAQMTAEELIVAAELKLPVVFIVFVNGSLGLVRQMQRQSFGSRFFATDLRSPDFVKLAAAYGVKGVKVSSASRLACAVSRAMKTKEPILIEVMTDREEEA